MTYYRQLALDKHWEEMFNELMKYKELHGTLNVPHRFGKKYNSELERKLANWVFTQRRNKRIGKLLQWRDEKLISVGFDFEPFETHFEEIFADFLKFKEKYGHTLVSENSEDFPTLYRWIAHIRQRPLTDERRTRLNNAGFVWSYISEYWQIKFRELVEFRNEFGHFVISVNLTEYKDLRNWAQRMRNEKRKGNRKGKDLSEDKIKLLDSIGFSWEPEVTKWENNLNNLIQFKEEYGHCHVLVRNCKFDGLGWWVIWLRKSKHKLTQEQISQIDSLGFVWNTKEAFQERKKLNLNAKE